MTDHALLCDIRDELRAIHGLLKGRQPLPVVPYEQVAAMMRASGPLMQAIPLPPSRGHGVFRMRGPLPDPVGTPGAVNPDYTEADIDKTIRIPGWTKIVRPGTNYTDSLKVQVQDEYGDTADPATRELDHLVPLCCLGHPTSQLNLWPQPRDGDVWNARVKDLTEVAAQHAILNGLMKLSDVQQGFMEDWTKLHAALFGNPAVVKSMMAMAIAPPEDEP